MPFKTKEEKRQYILEHSDLFKVLNITLDEKTLDDLVNDDKKEEAYRRAVELDSLMKKRETEAGAFFGPMPELDANGMTRVPRYLYDVSGTEEAQIWNQQLKEIAEGPNAARKLADMCIKKLMDFDDTIMTKSVDEIEKYAMEHFDESGFHFVVGDVIKNLNKVYNMNDPKEAAIANAARDKYVTSQSISALLGKNEFTANKLSTILPSIDKFDAEKLIDTMVLRKTAVIDKMSKANDLDEETKNRNMAEADAEFVAIVNGAHSYQKMKGDVQRQIAGMKKLAELNQLGNDGNYHRAYRETPNGRVYLQKTEVAEEIENKTDGDIKFEEVSDKDRKSIDDFRNETRAIGSLGVFLNDEKKRQFFKTVQKFFLQADYDLSDKKIDEIVKDKKKELEYLRDKDKRALVEQVPTGFTMPENIGLNDGERMIGGMHMRGDTEEARQWNENVNYMIQTPEGRKTLAAMAVKKLLSVDMSILAENDLEKRTQYVLTHPLEGKMLFLAANVTNAYESSLTPEEKENNPVLEVLATRKTLYEGWERDRGRIKTETSRILTLLPDNADHSPKLSAEHCIALGNTDLAKKEHPKGTPAETVAIYKEVFDDVWALFQHHNALSETKQMELLHSLYSENKLGEDSMFERFFATVEVKEPDGKTVKKEKQFTIEEMVEAISSNKLKYEDFRRETMSDAEKEKINRFLAETPDEPMKVASDDRKKELQQMIEVRKIKLANNSQINGYIHRMSEKYPKDPEMTDLLANLKKTSGVVQASEVLEKAFRYVFDHQDHSIWTSNRDKLEVALTTIAMLDGTCAKELVHRINLDRKYGNAFSKPELNLDKILEKSGIKPGNIVEKEVFRLDNPNDMRVQNLQVIYEHLRDDLNPWHHFNSKSFDKMMKSMSLAIEYASTSKSIDSNVLENMLKDVKDMTKAYMLEKDASRELGQNRKRAALAMVTALDPEMGKQLTNQMNAEGRTWIKAVVTKEELHQGEAEVPFNKEEILKQMLADIQRTRKAVQDPNTALDDKIDLTAQFMVKKRIYNSLKTDEIDKDSIAVNMSKFQIRETSSKLIRDDVYQKVVNSLGIKLEKPEVVEREFAGIKAQQAEKKNEDAAQAQQQKKAEKEKQVDAAAIVAQ